MTEPFCLHLESKMEDEIINKLNTKIFKPTGQSAGGCISSGDVYETDNGPVFVKKNNKTGSDLMFCGEFASLKALESHGMKVPTPLCYGKNYIVMDYLKMRSLSKCASELGTNLALLHQGKLNDKAGFGEKFGFETTTCCGFLPMDNSWHDDWVCFYAQQRIDPHVRRLVGEHGERQLEELWNQLQLKLPSFFKDIKVTPSLLHGDLWSGNAAETDTGPVVFDAASFYGHHEFDLAIAKMWGGLPKQFFDSYHSVIPKRPGFELRLNLYLLFHHLNHWSHFGCGYQDSSLRLMKKLVTS